MQYLTSIGLVIYPVLFPYLVCTVIISVTWELKKHIITRSPLSKACLLLIPYVESFILGLYILSGSQQNLSSTADSRGAKTFGEILKI